MKLEPRLCEEFGGHVFDGGNCTYCGLLDLPDHLLLENYVIACEATQPEDCCGYS